MPKDKISQYAFTPAANTDIGGINIDEGCAPSGINNAIRTLMTQIRDLQAGVSGDTIPLTAGGTGSGTAASARAALGLAIGTNVLGYVTPGASGNVLQSDGTNWTSVAATAVTLDTITGGPLTVAKGGTGATALASGAVLLGNGTSMVQFATAGATGQVLTSTGTGWVSQAASGGQLQTEIFTAPGTWTKPASATQVKVMVVGGGAGGTPTVESAGGGYIVVGNVPVSAPVAVTVGSGGNAPGGPGGTSSFGPAVSATGGTGGSPTATGTGTSSLGTVLRSNSTVVIPATPAPVTRTNRTALVNSSILAGSSQAPGATGNAAPLPANGTAWTTSLLFGAGEGGIATKGGIGGAVVVEYIG